ncbi:ABC transporter ATP-binding protein/permease [Flavobacteriales bacterium]|jgi:ATP-binding cassette, subfamily B, multidrug efflux pump|nr:ABC transporter ATP-binding protein/permease [Flavobacteriales bacterium]
MGTLAALNPFFWKYRGRLALGFLFVFLTNAFSVFAPVVIGEGINLLEEAYSGFLAPMDDGVSAEEVFSAEPLKAPPTLTALARWIGQDKDLFGAPKNRDELIRFVSFIAGLQALLYMLAYLMKGVFSFMTRQTIIVMSRLIEYDLKEAIYDQYQKLPAAFYKQNATGDLMNRISEDVSKVRMYLGPAVMYGLTLVTMMFLTVGVMLRIDVTLTLCSLAPLPLMSFGVYKISARIHRKSDAVQSQQSLLSAKVQQDFSGIRILAAHRREERAYERFQKAADEYKFRTLDLIKVDAMFMPIIVMLVGLSTILTIYVGGLRVFSGDLQLGHIFQFVFYVNLLTWPFASVGWVTSLVQKASASQARINAFLDVEPDIDNTVEEPCNIQGRITFKGVGLTYPDSGIRALDKVDFDLQPGKTLAVIGRTGSGKTSLAQLVARLYDPSDGVVEVDGTPLSKLHLPSLRAAIGYVPQDVFLFSDTIASNIAFGVDDAPSEDIEQAAKDAHVHQNIAAFPEGYETLLGERGVNLSGGQKQRISIARAVLRKPRILIFDDCLSAVDTETEAIILGNLRRIMEGRTSIIVSHRVSTVRDADLILVLDEGQVLERGTHTELMAQNGLYAELHSKQEGTASKED